jgi:thiamine pyrophosphate-dependent acetolactate synthase large subunit-like protein
VGTEFSEIDYYYQRDIPSFGGALIRVDIDPGQVDSGRDPTIALVGDAGETLAGLAACLAGGADRAETAAARADQLRPQRRQWPRAPAFFGVIDALAAALPPDVLVTADSTQLAYVANSYLPVSRPRSYLGPFGFGTLGPALPMAIGAQLAAPDRPVVCLIGDGGLLFTVAELATAVELELPIVILLWQNHGYGAIRDAMDRAAVPHVGTETTAHDCVAIAAGFGLNTLRVSSLQQVSSALAEALGTRRPTLVELSDGMLG